MIYYGFYKNEGGLGQLCHGTAIESKIDSDGLEFILTLNNIKIFALNSTN